MHTNTSHSPNCLIILELNCVALDMSEILGRCWICDGHSGPNTYHWFISLPPYRSTPNIWLAVNCASVWHPRTSAEMSAVLPLLMNGAPGPCPGPQYLRSLLLLCLAFFLSSSHTFCSCQRVPRLFLAHLALVSKNDPPSHQSPNVQEKAASQRQVSTYRNILFFSDLSDSAGPY